MYHELLFHPPSLTLVHVAQAPAQLEQAPLMVRWLEVVVQLDDLQAREMWQLSCWLGAGCVRQQQQSLTHTRVNARTHIICTSNHTPDANQPRIAQTPRLAH